MIIAVAGGKGGVGKTFVSTSLARAVAPLQFLDCDVEEPNAHLFLNPAFQKYRQVSLPVPSYRRWKGEVCPAGAEFCRYHALAVINEEMLVFPELCTGCGGCFLLCPEDVLLPVDHQIGTVKIGTGRSGISFISGEMKIGQQRATEVIQAVKTGLDSSRDVVIDCPPGNGRDTLEAVRSSDFCLLVGEPTPFGLSDLEGNKKLMDLLNIPTGVVINRAGGQYQELTAWCSRQNIPVLAEIPFDFKFASGAARGQVLQEIEPDWGERLRTLWSDLKAIVK